MAKDPILWLSVNLDIVASYGNAIVYNGSLALNSKLIGENG